MGIISPYSLLRISKLRDSRVQGLPQPPMAPNLVNSHIVLHTVGTQVGFSLEHPRDSIILHTFGVQVDIALSWV